MRKHLSTLALLLVGIAIPMLLLAQGYGGGSSYGAGSAAAGASGSGPISGDLDMLGYDILNVTSGTFGHLNLDSCSGAGCGGSGWSGSATSDLDMNGYAIYDVGHVSMTTAHFAAQVTLANDTWLRALNNAGIDYVNIVKVTTGDLIEFGADVQLNSVACAENYGANCKLGDMSVTSGAVIGTEESVSWYLDGEKQLQLYAESDGAGGIQNEKVKILSSMQIGDSSTDTLQVYPASLVLGSGAAGVDYCIDAIGETSSPTNGLCWMEDEGYWRSDSNLDLTGDLYLNGLKTLDYCNDKGVCIGKAGITSPSAIQNGAICIGPRDTGGGVNETCKWADTTPAGFLYGICIGEGTCQMNDASDAAASWTANVCIGDNSCKTTNAISSGYPSYNTCVGYGTCGSTGSGTITGIARSNTAIGFSSLNSISDGDYNTFVGSEVGDNLTSGIGNAAIGYGCGDVLTTGSDNYYGPGYNIDAAVNNESSKFAAFCKNKTSATCWFRGDHSTQDLTMEALTTIAEVDAATNTVVYPVMAKHQSSNNGAAGMGVGYSYNADDDGSADQEIAKTYSSYNDATGGSEDADFYVSLVSGGSFPAVPQFKVDSDGDFHSYGEMYSHDNVTATTIASSGTPVHVTQGASSGSLNGWTHSGGTLTCDVSNGCMPGKHRLSGAISFSSAGSNQDYTFRINKTDVEQDQCHARRTITSAGSYGSVTISCLVSIADDDTIKLTVTDLANPAADVTVASFNINVSRL